MATSTEAPAAPRDTRGAPGDGKRHFCAVPPVPEPVFRADLPPGRLRALVYTANKWVNGTVIHYHFFDREEDGEHVQFSDGSQQWRSWVGAEAQREVVRSAFRHWKELGIGLEFEEVARREEAELRIGFMQGDGAWSHIGTYVLNIGPGERTMNFGWDLAGSADGFDTALHEIGHSLGLPHEHQSPFAGILWDEEAVYAALAAPPNGWDRDTTYHNIIRKLDPNSVRGSKWDPDSVMHYPFSPGLVKEPVGYRENGITPAGGLSQGDRAWVRSFYPPLGKKTATLRPGRSEQLALRNGEQADFLIRPDATRYYDVRTFGPSDTVLVLFEEENGTWRYRTGDDDGGDDRNASLRVKLFEGRTYMLRARLRYTDMAAPPTLMLW